MKIAFIVILSVAITWTVLTLWVQRTGPSKIWQIGNANSDTRVLIIFDPDPFYNLDEQVCLSLGQAFADNKMHVQVATVAAAIKLKEEPNIFVFCANTYNWRPDWAVSNFIGKHALIKGKHVIALALGSGSTESAQRALEKLIIKKEGNILDSRSLWLMRPNDESQLQESNVNVAIKIAYDWGQQLAKRIK